MENLTNTDFDDILGINYTKWENIPVSTLQFKSQTSQLCYVSLNKDAAIEAYNSKSLPCKIKAYEYVDNVPRINGNVILAVELDTTQMIDLTNKNDYITYLKSKLNNEKIEQKVSLIRDIEIDMSTHQYKIVYIILDNRCVRNIEKI